MRDIQGLQQNPLQLKCLAYIYIPSLILFIDTLFTHYRFLFPYSQYENIVIGARILSLGHEGLKLLWDLSIIRENEIKTEYK